MQLNQQPVPDEIEEQEELSDAENTNEVEVLEDVDFSEDDDDNDDDEEDSENITLASTVLQYDDPVFVCAFSPDSSLVAAGSQDDNAYLIDSNTKEVLHIIEGHSDSVTNLGFSKNGKFLATGDMGGHIEIINVATLLKVWEITLCGDLNWLMWHNHSNFLLAGNSEGEVWLWLIPQGNSKLIHSSGTSTQAGVLSPDGKRIAVGYDDGMVRLFDLKTCAVLKSVHISSGSPISALSFHKDGIMILAGTADGVSQILNSNNGRITCSLLTDGTRNENDFIEVAQFCPHIPNYLVLAQTRGVVSVYDMNNPETKRHEIENCQVSALVWHPTTPHFYAACLDGTIKCYDVRNGELIKQFGGHTDCVIHIAVKNDGTYLMSASDDKTARIFPL